MMSLRMPPALTKAVDAWASSQDGQPSRSKAFRRLVELGLAASAPAGPHSPKAHAKSAALAHEAIDQHTDQTATPEEQANRKRRLLKGPGEFRELRRDQPAKKR
jgi:hypothetical protein